MKDSKQLAGQIGPTLIAITLSETLNIGIWTASLPAVVYLNGTLLFIGGLSVVRAHNHWVRRWPVVITLIGWSMTLLGLFRMFAPESQLTAAGNTILIISTTTVVFGIGMFLTFKAYSNGV